MCSSVVLSCILVFNVSLDHVVVEWPDCTSRHRPYRKYCSVSLEGPILVRRLRPSTKMIFHTALQPLEFMPCLQRHWSLYLISWAGRLCVYQILVSQCYGMHDSSPCEHPSITTTDAIPNGKHAWSNLCLHPARQKLVSRCVELIDEVILTWRTTRFTSRDSSYWLEGNNEIYFLKLKIVELHWSFLAQVNW